ncbi:MAG: diaminopimelate epimerase [Bacteroidia bacterium]
MKELTFYKYQGTGNDFVMIDNRPPQFPADNNALVARLCHRRFGIGADGLILLQFHQEYNFEMVYFNADGNPSSMCGNGGRCIAQFAHDLDFTQPELTFLAVDGPHIARFDEAGNVLLQMKDVETIAPYQDAFVLNTGSPHFVLFKENIDEDDFVEQAKPIRYNHDFAKEGINVNFVQIIGENKLKVRTYERGVEDETFSCGTGVVASALAYYHKYFPGNACMENSISIETKGGNLQVAFTPQSATEFKEVWLIGPAVRVFEGKIEWDDLMI